ncbi:MAG: endonuclease/exonuclease/phosphatase family protein [Eubacteriales bacterium]|nr:endonuclease/exonuclease/phosphatase family protein [Eubacteriales bacterium]
MAYLHFSYYRIEDNMTLTPASTGTYENADAGKEYTIITRNFGFGAYTADYTFFMDGGKSSWAASKESVINCVEQMADEALLFDMDFAVFQEIDTDGTRTYHVNESDIIADKMRGYDYTFAENYHSAFLMYPLAQPHGANNSGIMTLSKYRISSSVRRSLPISMGFSKFFDLDRCYSVSRISVDNGRELLIYNVHASAYEENAEIRTAQMAMLINDMQAEYEAGNYCVCGGDFNHDFTGSSVSELNNSSNLSSLSWVHPFPKEILTDGLHGLRQCLEYDDGELVPTCRNCDVPYGDDCSVVIVDGFIVSENIEVTSLKNIDLKFACSDHNPVVMKFRMK